MPVDDYIQIMIESLTKKSEILDHLIEKNEEQHDCVDGKKYEDIDWDSFNLIVAQRAYEMNSTAIQTTDEMMQTANGLKR